MSTKNRLTFGKGKDNTARNLTMDTQSPAYAATIAITPKASRTNILVGLLTGALTLTIGVGSGNADNDAPFIGDEVDFNFRADAGGARVVTFGTGFQSAGTLSVAASKFGSAKFRFNGTAWIEVCRAATA